MVAGIADRESIDVDRQLSGAVQYLDAHPAVRYAAAAAALVASASSAARALRAHGARRQIALAALTVMTASQAAGLVWTGRLFRAAGFAPEARSAPMVGRPDHQLAG